MKSVCARLMKKRENIVIDVSMRLPQGNIIALVGPSGSGKTSVLRMLAGLEKPDYGQVRTRSTIWYDPRTKIDYPVRKRNIGFVFQEYALFEHLNVTDNIVYGLARNQREEKAAYWLEKLQLEPLAKAFPRTLSGGQRQRVALGRAMAVNPELLLMDEPFSALDVTLRAKLRDDLKSIVSDLDCPVVLVTHDMEEAHRLADIIYIMDKGNVVRRGDVADVFTRPETVRAAQIMGWKNILPVDRKQRNIASGLWGNLILDKCLDGTSDYIAFEPQYARLHACDKHGINGFIKNVHMLGAYREIVVQCADGTLIYIHRPWDEVIPAPGSRVSVHPLQAKLQTLTSTSVCHTELSNVCEDEMNSRHYDKGASQSV